MALGRARGALGLAVVTLAALAPAATADVRVTADPNLQPPFKREATDYVSRCVPGRKLHVKVSASGGDRVGVGSHPTRSGDFTVDVARKTGAAFTVKVVSPGRTTIHHVRCLPEEFPRWVTRRTGTPQSQWYVLAPIGPHTEGYVAIFDAHGAPVWWVHASSYGPWDGKLLENGNLAWTRSLNTHFGVLPQEAWEERRLDGSLVRRLSTEGSPTDIHDLERLPNGHYLLITYRLRTNVDLSDFGGPKHARVYDGEIQEVTPGGKRVWSWNSKDHIKLAETKRWYPEIFTAASRMPASERYYDLVHLNSVEPDGDGYVISARFLDAVFRIDKGTGAVTWKLGGITTSKSLSVKGDALAPLPFDGQHDARLYGDHTLTVYDNGTRSRRPPRAVRYRIDTGKRTATMLEEIKQGEVSRSGWGGGARKLPDGNWVVYWGGTRLMTERTPSGAQPLAILFRDDKYSYRAFPIPPGRLSAGALRQGMNQILRSGRSEIAR